MYVPIKLEKGFINLPQTWHTYALKPRKYLERSTLQKEVLVSSPVEDVSAF
jgi:hypothetical protein